MKDKTSYFSGLFLCYLAAVLVVEVWLSVVRLGENGRQSVVSSDWGVALTGHRAFWRSNAHPLVKHLNAENPGKSETGTKVGISNFFNKMYTGRIDVGGQRFRHVVLDTGSLDLWVLSGQKSADVPKAKFLDYYYRSKSPTYEGPLSTWSIRYGTGSAQGEVGLDTVTIGGLTVLKQRFAEATKVDGMEIDSEEPQDGICGLGRHRHAVPTVMRSLQESGLNPSGVFSFFLTSHGFDGSAMIIGNDSKSLAHFRKANAIQYEIPLRNSYSGFWSLHLEKFEIGNRQFNFGSGFDNEMMGLPIRHKSSSSQFRASTEAILDTGTTYIGVPAHWYTEVMKMITRHRADCSVEKSKEKSSLVYMCTDSVNPLRGLPPLRFYLRDAKQQLVQFVVSPQNYVDDDGQLGLQKVNSGTFILGDTFITGYLTTLDEANSRVLLSETSHKATFLPAVIRTAAIMGSLTTALMILSLATRRFCDSRRRAEIEKEDIPLSGGIDDDATVC